MTATRILIHGAGGRMGTELLRLAADQPNLQVVATVSSRPVAAPRGVARLSAGQLRDAPEFDLAIDFSRPAALPALLTLCRERASGLVTGTTGLDDDDRAALDSAAVAIPLLWAPNFSLGVTVLHALIQRACAALPEWDVDVLELHHSGKLDAPSGTALLLGEAVVAGRGRAPSYHSLRAGDAVGEHSVQLYGTGERLELIHRATDRGIFARGALFAAQWLARQPAGWYRLEDSLEAALAGI